MNKNIRRGTVALSTVAAVLMLMASPASAATVHWRITGGTVTLHSTTSVTDEIPFNTTCTPTAGTGGLADVTTTTVQVTSFTTVGRFLLGTNYYVAELTFVSSTPGTLSGVTTTGATISSSTVTLRADVYLATTQSSTTPCDIAHGTTRSCRFNNVGLHFNGTYTGNVAAPAVSDTVVLNSGASTPLSTAPPCVAPFSTYIGGVATVSNLTIHICNVTSGTSC